MFFRLLVRRGGVAAWDAAMWFVALAFLVLIRYDLTLSPERWTEQLSYVAIAAVAQVLVGFGVHLYLGRSRFGSFGEVALLSAVVGIVALVAGGIGFVVNPDFSRAVVVTVPMLALLGMGVGRMLFRAFYGTDRVRLQVQADTPLSLIFREWRQSRRVFEQTRAASLLYDA